MIMIVFSVFDLQNANFYFDLYRKCIDITRNDFTSFAESFIRLTKKQLYFEHVISYFHIV